MAGFNLGALVDAVSSPDNAGLLRAMSERAGLDQTQLNSAIRALAPALAAGVDREASDGNTDALVSTLQSAGESQDLADVGDPVETGNALLGQLFGSRDVSRAVAADAAGRTGLSEDALKALLPVLTSALVSGLARNTGQAQQESSGLMGGLVSSLGGGRSGLASLAGQFLGGRAQQDDEPGVADDIMRLITRR